MTAPLIADRVSLSIRSKWLLRDVSLTLDPGEIVALVGPNGAGKSSLVRALAGDVIPTSGRVLLQGRPVDEHHPRELALKRAVLPQQTVLQFAFSVREVVEMGRGVRRLDDNDEIVTASLRKTDSLEIAERIYPSLSGGEQARVTLSRVLAQETRILLLDEPTASLDLHHQQLVMEVARDLAAEGASIVVILHDLNLAASFADRIGVMRDGELMVVGTPWETCTDELLSDVFSCPIAVVQHPMHDCPLVIPVGTPRAAASGPRPAAAQSRIA